jgi:hypothetical protein
VNTSAWMSRSIIPLIDSFRAFQPPRLRFRAKSFATLQCQTGQTIGRALTCSARLHLSLQSLA